MEIKTPLVELHEGQSYVADADGAFVIEEAHTLSDVVRWLVEQSSVDEIQYLLENL